MFHQNRSPSLLSCLDPTTGRININKFMLYSRFISDDVQARTNAILAQSDCLSTDGYDNTEDPESVQSPQKKQRRRKYVMARRNEDGQLEPIRCTESFWYIYYVENPLLEDEKFLKKFRIRFRLPYSNFEELSAECKASNLFMRWMSCDAVGQKATPIELLVLGALRYLGRGWTFDDIEECTAVSQEVHRVFFGKFIEFSSTVLYNKYVVYPKNFEEAKDHMKEYTVAGLPGALGSTDATHITTWQCEYNLRNNHLGGKSSSTTRSYNITVNHRRRILHSTRGGPGRWNDKTMVLFDTFVRGIRDGDHLNDVEFELFERRHGDIITIKYRGGYVIVDNGYLRWSATVPPYKVTNKLTEIRWSKWVESMRKDVECAFGILKGRWRILKTGVRVQGVESVDKVWLTCCALHNWLLEIDGLDAGWQSRILPLTSEWEGNLGEVDCEGLTQNVILLTTAGALQPRNYDTSGMGTGDDVNPTDEIHPADLDNEDVYDDDAIYGENIRQTSELGLGYFRSRLVEHFDILFKQNKIQWPARRGTQPNLIQT